MRLKSKVAVAIAVAALLVAVSAVTAFAAASQESVALKIGDEMGTGFSGAYGDEVVLQPACMSKIELPGDKFHFQVYINDVDASGTPVGQVWKDFGEFEDIQLEDTNTVLPFGFRLGMDDWVILGDGSVVHPTFPYQIRCEYKPAGSSTAPQSFSETETVALEKNTATTVLLSNGAVRKAGTKFYFQVAPNCGVGQVTFSVKKVGSNKTTLYKLTTDDNGYVSWNLKFGSNGRYRVSAKFAGNKFGLASPWTAKTVSVTR